MSLFASILRVFGIKVMDPDKPLTLLGQYYYDVQDKIYQGRFGIDSDVDWGIDYYNYDEEDPNVLECVWETRRILCTVRHDNNDIVVRAGKIYYDKSEKFIDQIISNVTAGKSKVRGRLRYFHYDPDTDGGHYHYDDDIYLRVYKEYDKYAELWHVEVEYIYHKPTKSKFPTGDRRSVSEDRQRIMNDIENHL